MSKTGTSVEEKIELLQQKMAGGRTDHIAELDSMRKTLKKAMLKKNFAEHPAMTMMLEVLRKREASYTMIIDNKRELTEVERRGFFEKRDEVRFLLSFFNVDRTIESIEKELDYQLSGDVRGVDSNASESAEG